MKIRLKNFQSIKDAEIEIGPLTVLVGQSDVGKSAVIRALYLLHRNQGGLELVKHGKEKLGVEQELDNGTHVSIVKGKGINSYFINDKSFSKVGRDIPEEVLSLLRTQELVLDKDQSVDLNFSRQFDSPFLLSDSAAIVTKAISSLSGINIIYSAIREGNSEQQRARAEEDVLRSNIAKLTRYDKLSEDADRLNAALQGVKDTIKSIEKIKSSIQEMTRIEEASSSLAGREVDLGPINGKIKAILEDWSALGNLQIKQHGIETLISRTSNLPEAVLSADFSDGVAELIRDICNLEFAVSEVDKKISTRDKLTDLLMKCYQADDTLADIGEVSKRTQESLSVLESQLKVCPTCGRPM